MIPERLEDTTTAIYKKDCINNSYNNFCRHTTYTHLGCVALRVISGLLIYFKLGIFKNILFLLCLYISIIIFFSYKVFKTENSTWKVYIRTILMYSVTLILNGIEHYKYGTFNSNTTNITGLLIIIDSLMGLQSRHIQNNFKE